MQIIVLFGLPGVGKSFVGNLLQTEFGFYHYDGDQSLPEIMKQAISQKLPITDDMRDIFFTNLTKKSQELLKTHPKLVISQTFIKEKYREYFLNQIPQSQFILIKADSPVREKRLVARKEYPLDIEYSQKMTLIFEDPKIAHQKITNNIDGGLELKSDLQKILDQG